MITHKLYFTRRYYLLEKLRKMSVLKLNNDDFVYVSAKTKSL